MIPSSLKERWLRTTAVAMVAAAFSLSVSGPSYAQEAEEAAAAEDEDTIVVTGSHIPRSEFTADNPITVISGDALSNSGFATLGEALRGELSTGSGGFSEGANLNGGGATSVDLRNLGPNAVLVLVNGKRVASFSDALANPAIDLSLIPFAMIDRVEILRDGASSTYGADALSGVINIILKRDFEGVTVSGQQGVSTHGDGEQTQLSMAMGGNFDNGKGNAVVGIEYRYQDPVFQRDREWAIPVITNPAGLNGSLFDPGGLFQGDGGAVFCTLPKAFGGDEVTDISGTPEGCLGFRTQTGPNDLARYDYALVQSLFNGSQLTTAAASVRYEAFDWLTFGIEAQFANRESRSYLDGNPGGLFGTTGVPNGWRVPATNPFNPTGEDGNFLIRPTSTVGPRNRTIEADLFRIIPSAYVDLDALGLETWQLELSYIWTKVNSQEESTGVWNLKRANVISDPALCILDPICVQAFPNLDPNDPADQPFFAMDVFRPGNWTQEQIDYIAHDARTTSAFELSQWYMLISGEVVDLPAGALGFAMGYEYREENGRNLPDSVIESGESVSNQTFRTEGRFDTHEIFGELNVPILKDLPFVRELTANLQGRWFSYSNFDPGTVWKVGVNFAPTDDIRLRYNVGTSFQAPTITQLFGGGTVSFDQVDDPCDATRVNLGPNPATRAANCATHGIIQPFTQPSGQYPVLAGSNPNLSPQTGDTWTAGVILTPRWVEGLQIAVDYYNIEVTNLIVRDDLTTLLESCYDSAALSAPECSQFNGRSATGVPIGISNPLINSDEVIQTDGLDWRVSYSFNLKDLGTESDLDLTIDWQGTWLFAHNLAPGKGRASDGISGAGTITDLEQIAAITAARNGWTFTWRARYIDDLIDSTLETRLSEPFFMEHDIRVGYEWNNLRFNFGVNNLFDEEPPYLFSISNNTDVTTFGTAAMGRYFFGRVTADF